MFLAVGVLAVAGYYYWKSKQTTTTKANFLTGNRMKTGSFSGPVGDVEK